MLSPDVYTLHPFLLLFQNSTPACGLGGSSSQSGPCTGTYGGSALSSGGVSVLGSGVGQVALVGLAALVLFALLLLLAMVKRAISGKPKSKKKAENGAAESVDSAFSTGDASDDNFDPDDLAAGEGFCYGCLVVYDIDDGCPFCGSSGCGDDEAAADEVDDQASVCAICGSPITDGDGGDSMFGPVHTECQDASEAEARVNEIDDDGPDGHNDNGIGAGDSGWRE